MRNRSLSTNIKTPSCRNIARSADLLRNGRLVAFPTETVYGLGANVFDASAVARIFEVKNRPRFDPIIVHIHSQREIRTICMDIDSRATTLMKKFWPGPLTLLLTKSDRIPDIVTAGLPTVAVRMPAHPVAQALIKETGTPLAAPSANPFGYLSPTTAQHVAEQLGAKVDLILDGGRCSLGVESTIIDLTKSESVLLRLGGLPVEEIEKTIGGVKISKLNPKNPSSPGQLPSHYAPHTPIIILQDNKKQLPSKKKIGLLAFSPPKEQLGYEVIEVLSPKGELREAASNLFSCLHRLDAAGLDVIYAESVQEIGLGRAIMDRLQRASAKRSVR